MRINASTMSQISGIQSDCVMAMVPRGWRFWVSIATIIYAFAVPSGIVTGVKTDAWERERSRTNAWNIPSLDEA